MIEEFDPNDEDSFAKMRGIFTPDMVDSQIHSAIRFAWMMLPKEKRTVAEVEQQIRRLVDRAFSNMREDFEAFLKDDGAE